MLRSTLSPSSLVPLPTLCCTFNDPRKVQELDVGSFVLECGREGKVRRSHQGRGLPEPRTPTRAGCRPGGWENPRARPWGEAHTCSSPAQPGRARHSSSSTS